MEKILLELLREDRSLLLRNKELIDEIEKRITPAQRRKFASLKMALENNVGEIFYNETDKIDAESKAKDLLTEVGMDSSRIDSVINLFENVITVLEEEAKAEEIPEPEPIKPEPPKPEPPKSESPKPEPPKPEPPKPEPPKPEPSKPEPPKPEPPKPEPPKPEPPKQQPPKPQNKFMIFLVVAIILGIFFSYGSSDNKETSSSSTPPSSATTPSSASVETPEAKTDLSLNGIDLGLDVQQMVKFWGEPMEKERREDGFITYHYGSIDVGIVAGKVHSFVTNDPKYKTSRGLHVGSNYGEVEEQYGTNSKNMDLEDLTLHEYPFTSLDGQYGLLRFAIDKSNRVNYISIRIVEEEPEPKEEPKKEEKKIDNNAEQAAIAFVNYHKAITRGDFVTAFSIMSSDQQSRMGPSLRDFSNGYKSTISSEITNLELVSSSSDFVVMKYVLDARDKIGGDTLYQQFAGEVEMAKIDGEWKIYSTKSKKIKEVKER